MRAAVIILSLAIVAALSSRAEALTVTIDRPASGTRVGTGVRVLASMVSAYDITAQATISGRTAPLTYGWWCLPPDYFCGAGFYGVVDLSGLPTGPVTLVVDASDTSGAMEQASHPLVYAPIAMSLNTPLPESVARTVVDVSGTCDQAGAPCPTVKISFDPDSGVTVTLATLTDVLAFDVPIDLSAQDGDIGLLRVEAADTNILESAQRHIAVEASPYLTPVVHVPGTVVQFDTARVLYEEIGTGNLRYLDLASGTDDVLAAIWVGGQLTSRGAVWAEGGQFRERRDGALVEHGAGQQLHANGKYVLYTASPNPNDLLRLDIDTDDVVTVTTGPFLPYVAPTGEVAWATSGFVTARIWFWDGTGPAIDVAAGKNPTTEGQITTWEEHHSGLNDPCTSHIRLADGTIEALVYNPLCREAVTQLFGGWVGYLRKNTIGVDQAWVRAPDGTDTQITAYPFPGSPPGAYGAFAASFGPGAVATHWVGPSGQGTDLTTFDGNATTISGNFIRTVFRDGQWFVVILGEIFEVIDSPPPPPTPDAGVPDASVPDASVPDAGAPDAAMLDAAMLDAMPPADGAVVDPDADPLPADASGSGADGDDAGTGPGGGGGCATSHEADANGLLALTLLPWIRGRHRRRERYPRGGSPMRARVVLLSLVLVAAASSPAEAITLTVDQPVTGRVDTDVHVLATIASGFDITAQATISGRTAPLIYGWWCPPPDFECGNGFYGVVSVAGLTPGAMTLVVDASDTSGAMQQVSLPVVYAPITVTIDGPPMESVARPGATITGTCDQAGAPCPTVRIGFDDDQSSPVIIQTLTDVTTLDLVVDLSAVDGKIGDLFVEAVDTNTVRRAYEQHIAVEASPYLEPLAYVPGWVRQVDGVRLLYVVPGLEHLQLFEIASGTTQTLSTTTAYGYLTSRGAVWTEAGEVHEWRDGVLIDHGSGAVLHANGHFVAYVDPTGLGGVVHRLDIDTDAVVPASSTGLIYSAWVATTGEVAWHASDGSFDIQVWFWNGTAPAEYVAVGRFPSTDGLLTTWREHYASNSSPCTTHIRLTDGTIEDLVYNTRCLNAFQQIFGGGWVGYLKENTIGYHQAWVRAPDGTRTQITGYPDRGVFNPWFGPEAVVAHWQDLSGDLGTDIVTYDGETTNISSNLIRTEYHGGEWLVVILGEVFRVVDPPPPPPPVDAGVPDAMVPSEDAMAGEDAMTPVDDAMVPVDAGGSGVGGDDAVDAPGAGCGCAATGSADGTFALALLVLATGRRRRGR